MAGEGAIDEMMVGFGDAGGVHLEQQEGEETLSDLGFIEEDDRFDLGRQAREVGWEDCPPATSTFAGSDRDGGCEPDSSRSVPLTNLQDVLCVQATPEVSMLADVEKNSYSSDVQSGVVTNIRSLCKNIQIASKKGPEDSGGNFLSSPSSHPVRVGQLESRMVKALSAQPYHPVFPHSRGRLHWQVKQQMVKALSSELYHPVSQDVGSSLSSQHPTLVNQMLEFPEHYYCVYHTHPLSLRPRTRVDTTFMTHHDKEAHPNVQETDFGRDNNIHMALLHDVSSSETSNEVANSLNKATSPLSLIKGHVAQFCIDQFGSRYIQENISTATSAEKAMVLTEIIPHAAKLVTDAFGNYVIQKVMEYGAPDHRRIIIEFLIGNVFALSCHIYGSRVIQRAIEIGDLDQKVRLAKELDGFIIRCMHDQNASHIVQKCIERLPQRHIQFIFKNMYGHVAELSTNIYGCHVIEKIIGDCDDPSVRNLILFEIMEQLPRLARDKHGNYIVQNLLRCGSPPLRSAIIRMFAGRYMAMSWGKFSSNVVEKCLMYGNPQDRQMIIGEILTTCGCEIDALAVMLDDPYANHVLQKLIEACMDWQRRMILECLNTNLGKLKRRRYGRHVAALLEKFIQT